MHFCVVRVYLFSSGSKVIKGVKWSNSSKNAKNEVKFYKEAPIELKFTMNNSVDIPNTMQVQLTPPVTLVIKGVI